MEQPSRFLVPTLPTHVCRLHKSLYDLKQALHAWYTWLSNFLLSIGFQSSNVDTYLYFLYVGCDICYLLVYVDDILLTRINSNLV